jgi:hypothetical protein
MTMLEASHIVGLLSLPSAIEQTIEEIKCAPPSLRVRAHRSPLKP